jgi:PAS domain S-box-containing protein
MGLADQRCRTLGGERELQDLEDFFENGVVALHWVASDGTILRANQAELDLLGYARENYVGHHIAEFHADRPVIDDILARLSRGEKLDKYPARLRARRSSTSRSAPMCASTRCFTVDVTAQERALAALRESERRSREVLDALPAAVYTTDAAGRITYYNDAAVELSGRRPELGSDQWCVTWRLCWPDGTPLPHDECPMAVALKECQPIRGVEAVAERPDGTRVPFLPYPTPLRDASGAVMGAVNMLVDLTD